MSDYIITSRCPWGCGNDRINSDDFDFYTVKCGQCSAKIPSPQTTMFAKMEKVSVEQWLQPRRTSSGK